MKVFGLQSSVLGKKHESPWMWSMKAGAEEMEHFPMRDKNSELSSRRPKTEDRRPTWVATFALAIALTACVSPPHVEDYKATWPEEAPSSVASNGAIYQAGHDVALFENAVARHVGDLITIHLIEQTSASKSSSTSTKKTTKDALPGPTILGKPVTFHGTEILSAALDHDASFDGKGDSAQSNKLAGDITVTVAKRLGNGNLLIRGQKWISINQGKEYVRIQGIIRPIDVDPDNSIASNKVADATISYGAQGALADANTKSWLARFFDHPLMPF